VDLLPLNLVGDGARIMGRGQPGGLRGVLCCAACMGRHMGNACSLACGPGRCYCRRVTDLASRRVRLGRKCPDPSDPHLAASEGSEAVDGITRA